MEEIEKFYDDNNVEYEWSRLDDHKLEFDITKKYLDQYLFSNSTVLDVGGGPGRYAFYLTSKGHEVFLVDLSAENINLAREKADEKDIDLKDYIHSDTLNLSNHISERIESQKGSGLNIYTFFFIIPSILLFFLLNSLSLLNFPSNLLVFIETEVSLIYIFSIILNRTIDHRHSKIDNRNPAELDFLVSYWNKENSSRMNMLLLIISGRNVIEKIF
ncbi:MAG: class I SAM-dependent methyltransferase [Candidatus Mcinerneyibacterium aminivorans]|jgi:SAM-dependent methyltransferase|uniref:Class I SAM-dependent methyltransferase n=1 Tax=Candidatus Mcinerneyibacterium aminivorans TaxID=2703815 RepID=A0A5D0MEL7_9BACT|nr:MAG: class I SAM-dependent methyltransferase [Candidatus Mcinerneyibacterium aminivorans]